MKTSDSDSESDDDDVIPKAKVKVPIENDHLDKGGVESDSSDKTEEDATPEPEITAQKISKHAYMPRSHKKAAVVAPKKVK